MNTTSSLDDTIKEIEAQIEKENLEKREAEQARLDKIYNDYFEKQDKLSTKIKYEVSYSFSAIMHLFVIPIIKMILIAAVLLSPYFIDSLLDITFNYFFNN